jgi:hypothetical protein
VRDTKVVHTRYWHDKEVMHSGYRCAEHEFPCGVVAHAIYGCTGLLGMCYILCMCVCVGASDTTTVSDDPFT